SGHCADGICCEDACAASCQQCSGEGRCDETPAADPSCEAVACPSDDVCRDFAGEIQAQTSPEVGVCASAQNCEIEWTEAADDGVACECDDETCLLLDGEPCARDADCDSSVCLADLGGNNICCESDCNSDEACSATGLGCELTPQC